MAARGARQHTQRDRKVLAARPGEDRVGRERR